MKSSIRSSLPVRVHRICVIRALVMVCCVLKSTLNAQTTCINAFHIRGTVLICFVCGVKAGNGYLFVHRLGRFISPSGRKSHLATNNDLLQSVTVFAKLGYHMQTDFERIHYFEENNKRPIVAYQIRSPMLDFAIDY